MGPSLIWITTFAAKRPSSGCEDVVGGAGAVGLGVAPVEVMVVNKGAIKHHAAMRLQSAGQQVGCVGRGASVAGGAGLALGVGLDRKPSKIGNERVNLFDLGRPPGLHRRVERVVGREAADLLRAGDVHAEGQTNAPRAHRVGHSCQLLQVIGVEQLRRGVHIIDVAAVDAHRGQQARVFGYGLQVFADVSAFEKDRPARIAALDRAVGIVPLVDPADGHGWVVTMGVISLEFADFRRRG